MEDSRPNPEENGSTDETLTPRKRRGGDFLSQYLLRRREKAREDSNEDDENEETEEKPKKFRRFFKGLFRNVVQPPEKAPERTIERPSLESLFFAWHDAEDKAETADSISPDNSERQPEEAHSVILEPSTIPTEESTHEVKPEVPTDSETVIHPDVVQELPEPERHEATTPSQEEMPPVPDIPERMPTEFTPETPSDHNTAVFERPSQLPKEREVVIERGPGMALPVLLVGAEYLARKKADRKLDQKFTKRVESLEKDSNRTEKVNYELQELVKQNRDQLEKLKTERGMPSIERRVALPSIERGPEAQVERPPVSRPEVQAQQPEVKPSVRLPEPETSREFTEGEKPKKPESYQLMEQVAEAADKGVAVERVFERSHEVKDDTTVPAVATSIGTIMAAQAAERQRIERQRAVQRQMGSPDDGIPVVSDTQKADMYRQAMHRGFWAAVVIIVFGTIAFLLK